MKIYKTLYCNRKKFGINYNFFDFYYSGIILFGDEVKSVKSKNFSFSESYCYFFENEIWIKNMHIKRKNNFLEKRDRKLLLKKKEINKIIKDRKTGFVIIPISFFINDRGFIKLQIALSKSKKIYDKRAILKEKDLKKMFNYNIF